jgi:hypothetical protein
MHAARAEITTDQKVGGSSPSERATVPAGQRPDFAVPHSPPAHSGRIGALGGTPEAIRVPIHIAGIQMPVQVKGAPPARLAVPALAELREGSRRAEGVRERREVGRQEPHGNGGATRQLRGGSLPATYERKPSGRGRRRRADAPHPQAGGTGRNGPLSAAPVRIAGPSSTRRAVSHRERSPSRARLRHVAATSHAIAQAPPLTLE